MMIKDIAKIAGVSVTTVSRVINNQSVGKASKEKVLKVIEQYEYYPNAYAQYLGRREKARCNRKTGSVSGKML